MQFLSRILPRTPRPPSSFLHLISPSLSHPRFFSSSSSSSDNINNNNDDSSSSSSSGWDDSVSSWSTGLAKDHFDGETVGHKVTSSSGGKSGFTGTRSGSESGSTARDRLAELEKEARSQSEAIDKWEDREVEIDALLKQIEEPGSRGSYLKDSEKTEMYKKHKADPEVFTVERLAKEYRIMRQRVHAILWLKELEEEEEKKLGEPLDDSVELLLDTLPEFFNSHCREFHVASLPYKPDFKVMPEGWDGTTRDPDEVHYEISKKEDDMLYEEFVQRFNFNKMKFQGKVKVHKYGRRRPSDGWSMKVEMLGPRGKRGSGGGWKFISQPDGSTRPLNEMEKMYVQRETPRRRRKILP